MEPERPAPEHRKGYKGRPNPLDDPEFAKKVAEAFAAGESRKAMCAMFGVKNVETITRWRRDARVKMYVFKIIEDRVLQVTRRVDGVISARLEEANDLSVAELLAIRKEFLGGALRMQTETVDEATISEATVWADENPHAMEQLESIMRTGNMPGADTDDE